MQTPNFVNHHPQKMEFSINEHLSNTHYSNAMLQFLYCHYLQIYWHRKFTQCFAFTLSLQHIVYWRSQVKFLGSDMVRRELLSIEQLNEDIRFALASPIMQVIKLQDGVVSPVVTKVAPAF